MNFNKSTTNDPAGVNYAEGDFNYDGIVNGLDFNILASKFGAHLAPASSAPPLTAALAAAPAALDLFGSRPISLQAREWSDLV